MSCITKEYMPTVVKTNENVTTYVEYPESIAIAIRLINFLTTAVITLLSVRVLFKFFGAGAGAPIVNFVYQLTEPLILPFKGIFPVASTGRFVLEPTGIVAIIFYILISVGITQLVLLFNQKE